MTRLPCTQRPLAHSHAHASNLARTFQSRPEVLRRSQESPALTIPVPCKPPSPFAAVDRTAPPMHAALSSCRHRESSPPDLARCATRVGLAPPDHGTVPMQRSHACKHKLQSVSVSSLLHPSPVSPQVQCQGCAAALCACALPALPLPCPLKRPLPPDHAQSGCQHTEPAHHDRSWTSNAVGQAMPRVGSCPLRSLCPLSLCPAHSAYSSPAVDALVMTLHHNTLHDISPCPAPPTALLLPTV